MKNQTKQAVLVEDDVITRKIMVAQLESCGFSVAAFSQGLPGLSYLLTNPVDLLVTDIFLPDIDGIDIIRSVRKYGRTPILAMSSQPQGKFVQPSEQALQAGADRFLAKPCRPEEMREILAQLCPCQPTLN